VYEANEDIIANVVNLGNVTYIAKAFDAVARRKVSEALNAY
jgi:hypothetical protein